MKKTLWCRNLFNGSKWLGSTRITIDQNGLIKRLEASTHPESGDLDIGGVLIPGFQNCHSHIFQYIMAGLVEHNYGTKDDFWYWRDTMYEIANSIKPEQLYDIATLFFSECLANGFTSHVEFHYLHHNQDGKPYKQKSIMSEMIAKAAQKTGMKLTLIPIYYNLGGFGKAIQDEQRRFYSANIDDYLSLYGDIDELRKDYSFILGHGIHSLRASSLEDCKKILNDPSLKGPQHIHIAEQEKEVEDFFKIYGRSPISWLLENISKETNLIHSTHISQAESEALAKSVHNVVLCPTTEGNLGDGVFPLISYHQSGGKWCIGTDSHINISPLAELNLADYLQRFISKTRNPLIQKNGGDSGMKIMERVYQSSPIASGVSSLIKEGAYLRAMVIDDDHPLLYGKPTDYLLSGLIYSVNQRLIKATILGSDFIARNGQHRDCELYRQQYKKTISNILKSFDQSFNR